MRIGIIGSVCHPCRAPADEHSVSAELLYPISWGGKFGIPLCQGFVHFRQLLDRFGPRRFIWGSDTPNVERYCTYRQTFTYVWDHADFLIAADGARSSARTLWRCSNARDPRSARRSTRGEPAGTLTLIQGFGGIASKGARSAASRSGTSGDARGVQSRHNCWVIIVHQHPTPLPRSGFGYSHPCTT